MPKEDILTLRLPFFTQGNARGTSADKDVRFVNGYFDVIKNPLTNSARGYFIKRPGLAQYSRPSGGNATGRGAISWNGKVYSVFGDKIYADNTDLGTTLDTSTGMVGWSATRPDAATPYLVLNDGDDIYYITTADSETKVSDPVAEDMTGDLVYMDGFHFVLGTSSNAIFNSSFDNPATWTETVNFITPIMENGSAKAITRLGDFIIVFFDNSMQAYYNRGTGIGSPLANYPQGMKPIGAASRDSVSSRDGIVMWVGRGVDGGYSVWKMESVGATQEVSTPFISRFLNSETTNITSCRGKLFRIEGHRFYILTLVGMDRSFVYDLDLDIWTEWQVAGSTTDWPWVDIFEHGNTLLVMHPTNGRIYTLSPTTYQDDSTNFTVLARLANEDLDTYQNKFVKSLEVIGDKQASTTTISLQYSDDDYITTSTARSLDMSNPHPMATNLGKFRRRSWQISYTGSGALRLEALEIRYRLGDK